MKRSCTNSPTALNGNGIPAVDLDFASRRANPFYAQIVGSPPQQALMDLLRDGIENHKPIELDALIPLLIVRPPSARAARVCIAAVPNAPVMAFTKSRRSICVSTPSPGTRAFSVQFAPDGKLIVSETGPGNIPNGSAISSCTVLPDGTLGVVSQSVATDDAANCWNAIDPDSKCAYASNAGTSRIAGFAIGDNCALSPLKVTIVGSGKPRFVGSGTGPAHAFPHSVERVNSRSCRRLFLASDVEACSAPAIFMKTSYLLVNQAAWIASDSRPQRWSYISS